MKRTAVLAASLAGLLCGPLSGAVLQRYETSLPRWEEVEIENPKALRAMHGFARCLVKWRPGDVARLLKTIPGSLAQRKSVARVARDGYCISKGELSMQPDEFRGALAEAMLASQSAYNGMLSAADPATTFKAMAAEMEAAHTHEFDDSDRAEAMARWAAYCAAHRAPDLTKALLATGPTTEGEVARLNQLNPVLARCVATDARIDTDRGSMRAYIAEAYYRRMGATE